VSKKPKPDSPGGAAAADLQASRNRARQLLERRGGGRHEPFCEGKQKVFLEFFATTCNAKWAARVAGVAYSTVYRHRMLKPAFARAWDKALEQGYARLEMRTVQQQFADVDEVLEAILVEGDWDVPDPPEMDLDRALQLLKHHHDRVMKIRERRDRELVAKKPVPLRAMKTVQPAPPLLKVVDDQEVIEALTARLVTFGAELEREAAAEAAAKGLPAPDGEVA
jgi:hypothetical protein